MSVQVSALMSFGFDIGGESSGWKLKEADAHGLWCPTGWYAPSEQDEADAIARSAELMLKEVGLGEVGFLPYRAVGERAGWIMATWGIRAKFDQVTPVGLPWIQHERVANDWDSKLWQACEALDITPKQETPDWLLTTVYGG